MSILFRIKIVTALLALIMLPPAATAETESAYEQQWRSLVKNKKIGQADMLCQNWLRAKVTLAYVQAHHCLSRVEAHRAVHLYQQKPENVEQGEKPIKELIDQHVKKSFMHLGVVMKKAPNDINLYIERINLLNALGRHQQALEYLDETIVVIKKGESLEYWIRIVDTLAQQKRYALALKYLALLDKHYHGAYRIIAKTAEVLMAKGDDVGAVIYLRKATAMAPRDPMNYIFLARHYELTGKIVLAEKNYMRAMGLKSTRDQRCEYGLFLRRYNRKLVEGCNLQKKNCKQSEITGCGKVVKK